MKFLKYRFTGGIKIYNAFNRGNERDVQTNITSPDYGTFYNPIQRSIGFVISGASPEVIRLLARGDREWRLTCAEFWPAWESPWVLRALV